VRSPDARSRGKRCPDEAIAEIEFVAKQLGSKVGMFGSNMARKALTTSKTRGKGACVRPACLA